MRWKLIRAGDRDRRAQRGGPTDRFRAVLSSRSRSQLIASLDDPSPRVASAAARRLAGSDRPQRRRATVYALARLTARETGVQVQALVDDPDADVRLAVVHTADALLRDPDAAMNYLTTDGDPEIRHAAELWLLWRREAADQPGGHLA
ncbi:MAG: hypothetical protein ACLPTJ_00790 [Solirubrobacteraceae bacterium]